MKYLKYIESSNNNKLTVIQTDDWEGLYLDDRLITEGHSIDWKYVLEKLGYNTEANYLSEKEWIEYLGDGGALPQSLNELRMKIDSKKFNL